MTSSSVTNLKSGATGPKVASSEGFMLASMFVSTVGSRKDR
ncbi:hypothetical protein AB395_00006802 (plasmid) [Sinorhizobium fredii CCBAU 45436]|nr:hypothetical protein AB395_00006802 [Sinorhizobium fredii CCBAU 45436]